MKEFFERIIDHPHFTFLLLENYQRNIGYAWFEIKEYKKTKFRKPYSSIYLHQLSIIEAERNKGFGSKLMEKNMSNPIYDLIGIGYDTASVLRLIPFR
jgi:hypothetical protein